MEANTFKYIDSFFGMTAILFSELEKRGLCVMDIQIETIRPTYHMVGKKLDDPMGVFYMDMDSSEMETITFSIDDIRYQVVPSLQQVVQDSRANYTNIAGNAEILCKIREVAVWIYGW